jgi:uncharacterized membrane protein
MGDNEVNMDDIKYYNLNEYNQNKTIYINKTHQLESDKGKLDELNAHTNKEYTLLIVWFIIAIFISIITIITIISETELNPIALTIAILFLLYVLYYFVVNIYFMFN